MPKTKPVTHLHNDGSLWSKGQTLDGEMHGYWEWYRKAGGAIMRSGYFDKGAQAGEWTTYDRDGKVYKVTQMKPKAAKTKPAAPKPAAKKKSAAKKRPRR